MEDFQTKVSNTSSVKSPNFEPEGSKYPLAGWVPTVNGRLSYRHLGESRHPTLSRFANVESEKKRIILAFQKRPSSDAIFQPLSHFIAKFDGNFSFVISALSTNIPDDETDIKGNIYIFKAGETWLHDVESKLSRIIEEINSLRLSKDTSKGLHKLFWTANRMLISNSDITVRFYLKRCGEVYFSFPKFKNPLLERNSINYAESKGYDFRKWVANQSYFFLRDISHTHQHHSPTSDTIIILQERNNGGLKWRKSIIYSLQYYIIRTKRQAEKLALVRAEGIFAYYLSYFYICQQVLNEQDVSQLPKFSNDALSMSLKAKFQEELSISQDNISKNTSRMSRVGLHNALTIGVVGLLFTFTTLFLDRESTEFDLVYFFINSQAYNIFCIIVILFAVMFVLLNGNLHKWHINSSLGRGLFELLNINRKQSIFAVYIMLALLLVITTIVGWQAIVYIMNAFDLPKHIQYTLQY